MSQRINDELAIIMRHYIALMQVTRSFQNDLDLALVAFAINLGQLENKPLNITGIAKYLNMPRSTVVRKVDILVRDWEYTVQYRAGQHFPHSHGVAELSANARRFHAEAMESIHRTYDALSKVVN
jgi:DNA-binding IclR family transcriptional regulator